MTILINRVFLILLLLSSGCTILQEDNAISGMVMDSIDNIIIDAGTFRRIKSDSTGIVFFSKFLSPMDKRSLDAISELDSLSKFKKSIRSYSNQKGVEISFNFNYNVKNIIVKKFTNNIKLDSKNIIGIIAISLPLFDESEQSAVFKVGLLCGENCGYEELVLVEKRNSKWLIIEKFGIGIY